MSLENYSFLKEQLYSKASFDFAGSTIEAISIDSNDAQEELSSDVAGSCKGTAGTFGTAGSVCGCAGTFGTAGTYGCGS